MDFARLKMSKLREDKEGEVSGGDFLADEEIGETNAA